MPPGPLQGFEHIQASFCPEKFEQTSKPRNALDPKQLEVNRAYVLQVHGLKCKGFAGFFAADVRTQSRVYCDSDILRRPTTRNLAWAVRQ